MTADNPNTPIPPSQDLEDAIADIKDGRLILLHIDGKSGDSKLEEAVASHLQEYFELWKTKQHDYGPRNISKFGEFGCVVRASDKMERLINLHGKECSAANEPYIDTWKDLLGYAVIALTILSGQWPGISPKEEEGTHVT